MGGDMNASAGPSRVRSFSRLAAVLTLGSMIVGGIPRHVLATPDSQLWVSRYNGAANLWDEANDLAVSPDGSKVFVTGYTTGPRNRRDFATVAYDASTGGELWAKGYNGYFAVALEVSPDGSAVYVTGYDNHATTLYDFATVAYDAATGAELWAKSYNGPGNSYDGANALGVSPDGSEVFVTGRSKGSGTHNDYVTIAYEAASGATLWMRRYDGPASGPDVAFALGVDPEGSAVYVTGFSNGQTGRADFATVAYAASTGRKLWAKRYDGRVDGRDVAYALAVSPDGSVIFVTGRSRGTSSGSYATFAYDASDGGKLWGRRYNGPRSSSDSARALGLSPDGSEVFVTGWSRGTHRDYATVAYGAAAGVELWATRYNGPGDSEDIANGLEVSPDGSEVFVTGGSFGSTSGSDYVTVAYDAFDGGKIWLRRYNGPGNSYDFANAIGVSPQGSQVFVTGASVDSTAYADFATVAYGAA
jgi:sugar lactone lactonase YvrE